LAEVQVIFVKKHHVKRIHHFLRENLSFLNGKGHKIPISISTVEAAKIIKIEFGLPEHTKRWPTLFYTVSQITAHELL
jgi:hypothetical protein